MYKVYKTLAKTVELNFNNLQELHDWAAKNRYTKSSNVKVLLNNQEILNVRSIYDVYSVTIKQVLEERELN